MLYAMPGQAGAKVQFKSQYDNFIGGKFVAPVRASISTCHPITFKPYTRSPAPAPRTSSSHWMPPMPQPTSGAVPATERSNVLLKIADRLEQNLEILAYAETVDNGKPIRETLNADIPLAVDHFRYFAGCLRARKAASPRSTKTPSPITSTSRWASSARSSPGTSRS